MSYTDEESPLLGEENAAPHHRISARAPIDRVHWVDNLRAVLTILLIFHHASIHASFESLHTQSAKATILPLALFITANKSFLYGLFFFLSGYSTFLSLRSRNDFAHLLSRSTKLGLPVFLYINGGQAILRKLVNHFARPNRPYWYVTATRLEGPTSYVLLLLLLECIYIFTRGMGRRFPLYSFARIEGRVKDSRRTILFLFAFSVVLVTGITIGNCFGLRLVPFIYPRHVSIEFPGLGAPVTYIIAYIAGVNFPLVKRYVLVSTPWRAVSFLVQTEVIAFVSLGLAAHFSEPLWEFIKATSDSEGARWLVDPGFNLHTIFFTLWNPFVFYTVSIGVISSFALVLTLGRDWGVLTRHTYTQTFVHMVPVIFSSRLAGDHMSPVVRAVLGGLAGVGTSWALGLGVWKLKEIVIRRMGWRLPVEVTVKVRYAEEVPDEDL